MECRRGLLIPVRLCSILLMILFDKFVKHWQALCDVYFFVHCTGLLIVFLWWPATPKSFQETWNFWLLLHFLAQMFNRLAIWTLTCHPWCTCILTSSLEILGKQLQPQFDNFFCLSVRLIFIFFKYFLIVECLLPYLAKLRYDFSLCFRHQSSTRLSFKIVFLS
jgi:hypothetical protein